MFLKRKKDKNKGRGDIKLYDPKKIYLLKTVIISDCDDGSGKGPTCITQYFLATKENEKFYELFSKVEIEYADTSTPGYTFGTFNTPMIEKVEELKKHVVNPNQQLTVEDLFYFLNMVNAKPKVWEESEETEEDEE